MLISHWNVCFCHIASIVEATFILEIRQRQQVHTSMFMCVCLHLGPDCLACHRDQQHPLGDTQICFPLTSASERCRHFFPEGLSEGASKKATLVVLPNAAAHNAAAPASATFAQGLSYGASLLLECFHSTAAEWMYYHCASFTTSVPHRSVKIARTVVFWAKFRIHPYFLSWISSYFRTKFRTALESSRKHKSQRGQSPGNGIAELQLNVCRLVIRRLPVWFQAPPGSTL